MVVLLIISSVAVALFTLIQRRKRQDTVTTGRPNQRQETAHPNNSTTTTTSTKASEDTKRSDEDFSQSYVREKEMTSSGLQKYIKTNENISYAKLPANAADGEGAGGGEEAGRAGEEYHEYDVPALELTLQPSEYETPIETSAQVAQNVYETINDINEEEEIYEEIQ